MVALAGICPTGRPDLHCSPRVIGVLHTEPAPRQKVEQLRADLDQTANPEIVPRAEGGIEPPTWTESIVAALALLLR